MLLACAETRACARCFGELRIRCGGRPVVSFGAVPGRLAQLGERRLDKAEVTGSSPVSPTNRRVPRGPVFAGPLAVPGGGRPRSWHYLRVPGLGHLRDRGLRVELARIS